MLLNMVTKPWWSYGAAIYPHIKDKAVNTGKTTTVIWYIPFGQEIQMDLGNPRDIGVPIVTISGPGSW